MSERGSRPAESGNGDFELDRAVRVGARALARAGMVTAFGHFSARIDSDRFLVCAPRPMGLLGPDDPGTIVGIAGDLPPGVLGEVRIHQAVYARDPDVRAIARSTPPAIMALSAAAHVPQPRNGFGSYFADLRFWHDARLIRSAELAAGVAEELGPARAIVLRGNGVVVVGDSVAKAVALTWFLEEMARLELAILSAGLAESAPVLTAEETAARATFSGQVVERLWEYLIAGDPEAPGLNMPPVGKLS